MSAPENAAPFCRPMRRYLTEPDLFIEQEQRTGASAKQRPPRGWPLKERTPVLSTNLDRQEQTDPR